MRAEKIVQALLDRTHDVVAAEACDFFKKHGRLKDIKASQMSALKAEWEKCRDWQELKTKLDDFLEHQKQRDEKVGVTGWKNLAADLLQVLEKLPGKVQADVLESLTATARKLQHLDGAVADGVEYFFHEPDDGIRKQRVFETKYLLARDFLGCLHRLYRGREVLREAKLIQGQLYGQGYCHADL